MIPIQWYVGLACVLFCIGVCGFLTRRNVIMMLLSAELMLNAVNLNLVAMSHYLESLRGQAFTHHYQLQLLKPLSAWELL